MMTNRSKLTVLLVLAALAAAGCGSSSVVASADQTSPPPPTESDPTTTVGPVVFHEPLTGRPVTDPNESIGHAAVVVKIDDAPQARPQTGINQADIVYEPKVEGITRFAAVFHSQSSDPVGPIRSARSTDIELLANLNHPMFGWSGANPTVAGEVAQGERDGFLQDLGADRSPDDYWRDNSRQKPHNLYTSTPRLLAHAFPANPAPHPLFTYRADGEPLAATAQPVTGVAVDFESVTVPLVEFVWDPEIGGWRRYQTDTQHKGANAAHVDSNGVQVAPENVVVLSVEYRDSAAGAYPQAITTGGGEAHILTGGHMVVGTWSRPGPKDPIQLLGPDGAEVKLTPGRTWILLPSPGHTSGLSPERGAELLSFKR